MNKIVVIKVYMDIINRVAGTVQIGFFDKEGTCVETKLLSGKLFLQSEANPIREGQELKLIPAGTK